MGPVTPFVPALIGAGGAIIASRTEANAAERAAGANAEAIAGAQQIMADAQVEAARLIADGQAAAAGAIIESAKISAKAAMDAAQMSVEAQERFFAIADAKLEPFREQGLLAGDELASMLGIPNSKGELVPYDSNKIRQTPGYEFFFKEGQTAVEKSAAGTKLSGEQLKDQTMFGQGYAERYFQNRVGDLQNLYGVGANAAGQLAQAATNTGGNIGNTYSNMGNQLSSIYNNQGANLANIYSAGATAQANLATNYANANADLLVAGGINRASLYQNKADSRASLYRDIASGASTAWGLYQGQQRDINRGLDKTFEDNPDLF